MELLKLAIEWAKAEVFSTRFFIFFALLFLIASIGFWQLGKTEIARAYIIPTLVAGILLMIIGLGLFYTNKSRITEFENAYNKDASAFIESEIERTESTLKEYSVVFKVIPIIIIVAALLIMFLNSPIWRAISITTIAMLIVILYIDGTAHARIDAYHKELVDRQEGTEFIRIQRTRTFRTSHPIQFQLGTLRPTREENRQSQHPGGHYDYFNA